MASFASRERRRLLFFPFLFLPDLESGFSCLFLSSLNRRVGLDSLNKNLACSSHGCGKSKSEVKLMLTAIGRRGRQRKIQFYSFSSRRRILPSHMITLASFALHLDHKTTYTTAQMGKESLLHPNKYFERLNI